MARALSVLPVVNAALEGARPRLGFGILLCPQSGSIYRVIFESIDNTEMPLAPMAMSGAWHRSQGASCGAPRGSV